MGGSIRYLSQMRSSLFSLGLLALLSLSVAVPLVNDGDKPVLDDKEIDEINNAHLGWIASRSSRFEGMSRRELRGMLGVVFPNDNEGVSCPKNVDVDIPMSPTPSTLAPSGPDSFTSPSTRHSAAPAGLSLLPKCFLTAWPSPPMAPSTRCFPLRVSFPATPRTWDATEGGLPTPPTSCRAPVFPPCSASPTSPAPALFPSAQPSARTAAPRNFTSTRAGTIAPERTP